MPKNPISDQNQDRPITGREWRFVVVLFSTPTCLKTPRHFFILFLPTGMVGSNDHGLHCMGLLRLQWQVREKQMGKNLRIPKTEA